MPPESTPLASPPEPYAVLLDRIRELESRLDESNETLRAFTSGEVDAIVASGPAGDQVYTLKGADETYRVMVQAMAEGALTLTAGGLILFSNEQFASMLNTPLERVIGSQFLEFIAPSDSAVASALLGGMSGGTGGGMSGGKAEVRLMDSGAKFVPVYLAARQVTLDGADCHCMIVTDLSAQKRYEEMVAVMEAVPVGVLIARDTECLKMVGNSMAHKLLRTAPGTDISAPIPDRTAPGGWREMRDGKEIPIAELPMQTAARSGRPVHDYEFNIEFDDGTTRCWLGNAVPLFDELRRPRGTVGAFVDITDRKRAAETLAAANTELRNFVDALAHGIEEPSRLKELLRYWEVTERGSRNVSDVDCGRALSQAQANLGEQIRESHAVITAGPMPTVVADEVTIVQVFENLLSNSMRYRSDANPEIHVSALRTGERWLFTVRDNGCGIDRADAELVFGMFGNRHAKDAPMTGIGLALCRKVVEGHGGRIWVESEPGQGAAFRFTIPIYLDPAEGASSGPETVTRPSHALA